MDPEELEFLGEKMITSVIPNFTHDAIHLICGSFGPFRAGIPVNIPLWFAGHLRKQQKCRYGSPSSKFLANFSLPYLFQVRASSLDGRGHTGGDQGGREGQPDLHKDAQRSLHVGDKADNWGDARGCAPLRGDPDDDQGYL